jgi:capsular polysaccharide transport system permease protein
VRKLFSLKNNLFLLCVALPTLAAVVYYTLIASDVYISESQLIIRTPEKQSSSLLGDILQGSGFVNAQTDAYTVEQYILSRDAVDQLDKKLALKEKFSSPDVDLLSRFGGILPDRSNEALHRYYQNMVEVTLDTTSSIITLRTRAFHAQDALEINQYLLNISEQLVNKLNDRARQDMLNASQREVDSAEEKSRKASIALARYQNTAGVVDPVSQTAIPLQQISKLQDELLATRTQILQVESLTPENPQLPILHKRVTMLQKEIDKESAGLTGSTDKSMVNKAVQYSRLTLEKEFADKQLASVLASREMSRAEAQRQQLYVENIAKPSLSDEAQEPKRLKIIATVFILGMVSWGVLGLLVAGIKEHKD